jgi:hypothetical protein
LLSLDYIYNITELSDWKTTYDIDSYVEQAKEEIVKSLENIANYSNVIDESMKNTIKSTATDVNNLLNGMNLKTILNDTELQTLVGKLNETAEVFPNDVIKSLLDRLVSDLESLASDFSSLQSYIKENLKEFADQNGEYHFNFGLDVSSILEQLGEIFIFISGEGEEKIMDFFSWSINALLSKIDAFIDYAVAVVYTKNRLGNTEPIGRYIWLSLRISATAFWIPSIQVNKWLKGV